MKYETTCLHHFMMVENLVVFFQRQYQSGFLSIAEEGRITWEKKVENGVKSAVVRLLVIPFVAKRDMKLLCTLLLEDPGKNNHVGNDFYFLHCP